MKHYCMIIIMNCAALTIGTIAGTYAYYSYNEEIVNKFQINIVSTTPTTRLLATVSNATVSNATLSNWEDTDLDNDELEWIQGDNVELTNDLSE